VSLSTHPAPTTPLPGSVAATLQAIGSSSDSSELARCPAGRWHHPFAPRPLQALQRYYGWFRPCAPPRYSGSCGISAWAAPLASGRQVPRFRMWARFVLAPP